MKYQVVILAGGESSRFFPFNNLHKSFFKIAGKTILERTVESVKKLDPSGIIVVLGSKNFDKEKEICKANPLFEDVSYVKEEQPLGQADAILSAKEFITDDFFILNANQFNFDKIAESYISEYKEGDVATLGIIETDTPEKYGIVEIDGGRVRGIVEKPEKGEEPSNMRIVGTYLFAKSFLTDLSITPISTYSLETTLNGLAKKGKIGSTMVKNDVPSIKYPWDLFKVKEMILSETKSFTDSTAVIEKTAVLKGGNIFIGKNAHIYDYAVIEGPAYIGENAVVGTYCILRNCSVLEKNAQVERYCDIRNSLLGEETHIHSRFVGDSIIGKDCRIGAEFITANKRLDRNTIRVLVNGEKIDTGKNNIGVFLGDNVKIGVRVTAMPGSVVAENSVVYPDTEVKGFFDHGSEVKNNG